MTRPLWHVPPLAMLLGVGLARAAGGPAQRITLSGAVASVPGPAKNFTGRVRVDPLSGASGTIDAASADVTPEPGARSAWHMHPDGQDLVVTVGAGLTLQWGQPVQELRAGDVVWCLPGVKH